MDTKSILKIKIRHCAAIFAVALFFFAWNASAATVQINSRSGVLSVGDTATFSVSLNSEGISVNNAEASIKFPTEFFDIISVSKNGSIFSLWVEEPSFSNSAGTITFNGGIPTPGFNGAQGTVVSFVARAKKAGQAEFSFSDAAVRANDGLGTDVLSGKQGKSITIVKTEEPASVAPAAVQSVSVLQVSSATHPNQDQWYKDNNPEFAWALPAGLDAVQTVMSKSASDVPGITYSPAISKKMVKDLEDGVWYFKVRSRKNGVWGPVSTYIARIDTTPPEQKSVAFAYDDNSHTLAVTADIQDITSGIDHYQIFVNDVLAKTVQVKEFIAGRYSFRLNVSGDNTVKLRATDRAGNEIVSSGTFHATGISVPDLDPIPSSIDVNDQLLVRGRTPRPGVSVTVLIRRDMSEPVVLKTKSSSDGSFSVLTSKLSSGRYDIWAETGSGDSMVSSALIHTEAIVQPLIPPIETFKIVVLLVIIIAMYYSRHGYKRILHRYKMRGAVARGDNSEILLLLKKRLEKHLEILQRTRRGRILTKEEKEIKEAIEGDLDEVDQALGS